MRQKNTEADVLKMESEKVHVFLNKILYWTLGQMYIKPEADKDGLKWCR